MGILGAMMFVRFGLEPLVKSLRTMFKASGSWEKSSEYHFLREVRTTVLCVFTIQAVCSKAHGTGPPQLDSRGARHLLPLARPPSPAHSSTLLC